MNEKIEFLLAKVTENKDVLIKIGSAVVGALLGVVIAGVIASSQEPIQLTPDDLTDFSDEVTK